MSPAPELCLGRYWGLRRIADDGGRFMLLDLRGLDAETLAAAMQGLAPFATGVVLAGTAAQTAWRRHGSAHVGRIDALSAAPDLRRARISGADAVLTSTSLAAAARELGLARLGDDRAADLRLGRGPAPALQCVNDGTALIAPEAAGYLLGTAFLAPVLALEDAAARRRCLADDLVPSMQRLNAQVADLATGCWVDG